MGRLKLCRICLVENVRMFIVADSHLQDVFEKLTNIPFMTEDSRPMLACFFCYARLKQCHSFMMKCLEAEEVFAQMLNEDYEQNPLQVHVNHQSLGGYVKAETVNIDIVDGEPQLFPVKEELPVDDGTDDINLSDDQPDHDTEAEIDIIEENDGDGAPLPKRLKLEEGNPRSTIVDEDKKNGQAELIINNNKTKKCRTDTEIEKPCTSNSVVNVKSSHKCDICRKRFNNKGNLLRHIRTHTGEKPYKCDICQKSFTQNVDMKRHIQSIHAGEKPYKCDICQNSFTQKSKLNRHARTHSDEKPYECDICLSSFSRLNTLNYHKYWIHKQDSK